MPLYHFDDRICSIRKLYKGKVFFCLRSCHTWKKYWKILCEKCIGRRSYIKLTFFLWSLIVGLYFPFKIFPSKKKKRKEKKVKIKAWPKRQAWNGWKLYKNHFLFYTLTRGLSEKINILFVVYMEKNMVITTLTALEEKINRTWQKGNVESTECLLLIKSRRLCLFKWKKMKNIWQHYTRLNVYFITHESVLS